MPAPGSLPSPNANHFINLCLIKWLVWNYPQLDTYPHSPGNAPLFFPSPRSFGSTQSSRRFLPILPQHSFDPCFMHCLKWSLSSVTKWLSRRHIVRNRPSYKMIRPAKNTPATKWHGSVLQNATFFFSNASETGTWVTPFYNRNGHRDSKTLSGFAEASRWPSTEAQTTPSIQSPALRLQPRPVAVRPHPTSILPWISWMGTQRNSNNLD